MQGSMQSLVFGVGLKSLSGACHGFWGFEFGAGDGVNSEVFFALPVLCFWSHLVEEWKKRKTVQKD